MALNNDYTQNLPVELVSRILRFNMEDVFEFNHTYRGIDLKSHLDITTGPWAYAHVCHRWRTLVWSDIRFWSDLALNLDRSLDAAKPGRVELLRRTIERYRVLYRPGGRLLRVHILDDKPSKTVRHPYLDEIVQTSPYWHTAAISLTRGLFPSLEAIRGNLPHLHTLDLKSSEDDPLDNVLDAFSLAPSLSEIQVFGFPSFSRKVRGPWHLVRRMTFMFVDLVDALDVLVAARDTVDFLFLEQPSGEGGTSSHELGVATPVEMSRLDKVMITIAHPDIVQAFSDTVTLPALKHILVQTPLGHREALTTPEMMASFCRMLSRSNVADTLHTLDFTNVASDDEVAAMLRLVPGVKWLGLMNCSIATAKLLTYTPFGEPCLCREVTKFRTMLNQPATSPTVAAYIELMHSRQTPRTDDAPHRPVHLPWVQIIPFVDPRDIKPSDRRKLRRETPSGVTLLLAETKDTPWLYEYAHEY